MSMNDTSLRNNHTSNLFVDTLLRKVALGCLLASLSIFTVCGNVLVLYAIRTEKRLRTVANLFILSLALADLSVGFFVMPLSAATIIAGRWPFSSVICQMWLSIDYVASTASIFNLVLLSLDRYWAVVHPLRYLQNRTRKRATIFILIVWFISSLWAPAVILWSYIVPQYSDIIGSHECDTAFRSNKTFKTLTALVNFYFPLLTMIIISCRIMATIRSRSKMEFGRRLSSFTQKQMKRERIYTNNSMRSEHDMVKLNSNLDTIDNQMDDWKNLSSNDTYGNERPSSTSIVANPLDSLGIESNILPDESVDTKPIPLSSIPPGICHCSTCQTCKLNKTNEDDNDGDDDSLWQPQQPSTRPKESQSTDFAQKLHKRLSFIQIKPILILFPSTTTTTTRANRMRKSHQPTSSKEQSDANVDNGSKKRKMKNSLSVSSNTKYKITIGSTEHSDEKTVATKNDQRLIQRNKLMRTASVTSSFTEEYLEKIFINSIQPQEQTVSALKPCQSDTNIQTPTSQPSIVSRSSSHFKYSSISNNEEPSQTHLKVPVQTANGNTMTMSSNTSIDSPVHKSNKMNCFKFFDKIINPSRSSSLQKELKAARQLGMLVGVFTVSWLPYFILFLVVAWCQHCVSDAIFTASIWLGYLNSALNPLIYPLCNTHFRRAFQKIFYCKHAKTKLPNLNALRELHALHAVRRQRRR